MLIHRVISSVLLIAAILATALWAPGAAVAAVLALTMVVGVLETASLLDHAGLDKERHLAVAGSVILAVGTFLSLDWDGGGGLETVGMILAGFVPILFLLVMFRPDARPLESIPCTLLLMLYVPFLLNFLTLLIFDWPDGEGRWTVLYLMLVVKITDIGAYFVGSAMGRHKLFPRISPAKTWEGCAGGVVAATMASVAVYALTGGDLGVVQISLVDAVVLGVLLSLAGILGDLVESMLKRSAGVKDSGTLIRGLGGLLDVIDSLLLASPVLYFYLRFVVL